ncbi:hypothetical protein OMCYN_00346 [cyanobiont of Ornithocercus magnificus]|nr:hypothetical protein OMCYN_00346 [cyanobiont of Ornithocercus magnificus]
MSVNPLTDAVSDRICRHMNDDHADAVTAYARHFGCVVDASYARMVRISPKAMDLDVDGRTIIIPFDHELSDSEDAHRTLVAMLRSVPLSR